MCSHSADLYQRDALWVNLKFELIYAKHAQHDLPTKIEQPEGVTTELTYNVFGNVTAITQDGLTESRLYDAQQRLCRQVRPDVGHTAYGYNAIGEMVWEAKGASGSASSCATISVLAAEKGQSTRVGSYATGAEYAASGQLLSFNYGNGLSFSQTLDAKFRPATRSVGSGTTLFAHTYSYDLNSNLLALTDSLIPVNSITLSYDRLDRLTSADGAWGSGSFSYDALGNITHKTLGSEHINYHYNSAKRLTSVSGAHARSFNYDSRGNVISNGARSFTYNRANRLTSSGGITYQYDGHGRRVSKTQGGTKTYSLYNQQGTLLATYKNGNYVEYYHLGQQLVARYNDAPQQGDGLGYTGHLEDDDLELTYMQQRYYDPLIGRFYSNDPVGFTASNPMMFNRYAYVNNNPYRFVDPDGREPEFKFEIPSLGDFIASSFGYRHTQHMNQDAGGDIIAGSQVIANNASIMMLDKAGSASFGLGIIPHPVAQAASLGLGVISDAHNESAAATSGNMAAGSSSLMLRDIATNSGQRALSQRAGLFSHVASVGLGLAATDLQKSNEAKFADDKQHVEEKH